MASRPKPAAVPEAVEPIAATLMRMKVDDLRPNPRNPRRHPEKQVEQLMASLRRHGQYKPVLARKANNNIIAGHGITTAMRRLGWAECDVLLWDCDEKTADAAMLADNRLSDNSQMDERRVAELLREMKETEWYEAGFTVEEGNKFLEGFEEKALPVYEVETKTVSDHFWIGVRGPLGEQAKALQRLKVLMHEMPAVTIELGFVEEH